MTRGTVAHGDVVDDVAYCVLSASAWARVGTFVANARFVSGTLGADHAFGSASDVRISLVFGIARAHAVIATSVRSARGGITRVDNLGFDF